MKSRHLRSLPRLGLVFSLLTASALPVVAAPAPAQPPPPASPPQTAPDSSRGETAPASGPTVLAMEKLMWREARNQQGKSLGIVSDLLAQLPSGQIIYLSITPGRLYGRPKVVPPGAVTVPDDPRAPLQIDITEERWINAPVLDWNDAMVIKPTEKGAQIYAYYEQSWLEPPPGVNGPVNLSVDGADAAKAQQYVALRQLLHERVTSQRNEQTGYLSGFLINWPDHRVTHALVAPRFPPVPQPDDQWFAVPLALLTPPDANDTIVVRADTTAFNQAAAAPAADRLPTDNTAQIYRYPAADAARVVATE